jgi:hypothetical protein
MQEVQHYSAADASQLTVDTSQLTGCYSSSLQVQSAVAWGTYGYAVVDCV